eukprot:Awhi_evm1s14726
MISGAYSIHLKEEAQEFTNLQKQFEEKTKVSMWPFLASRPSPDLSNMRFKVNSTFNNISKTMIGCSDSHHQCFEKIAQLKDDSYVLVTESDATILFDDSDWKALEERIAYVTQSKEIKQPGCILLGSLYDFSPAQKTILKLYQPEIFKPSHYMKELNDDVFEEADICMGTHAYLLNAAGAKTLLKYLDEISYHIDFEISLVQKRFPDEFQMWKTKKPYFFNGSACDPDTKEIRTKWLTEVVALHFPFLNVDCNLHTLFSFHVACFSPYPAISLALALSSMTMSQGYLVIIFLLGLSKLQGMGMLLKYPQNDDGMKMYTHWNILALISCYTLSSITSFFQVSNFLLSALISCYTLSSITSFFQVSNFLLSALYISVFASTVIVNCFGTSLTYLRLSHFAEANAMGDKQLLKD